MRHDNLIGHLDDELQLLELLLEVEDSAAVFHCLHGMLIYHFAYGACMAFFERLDFLLVLEVDLIDRLKMLFFELLDLKLMLQMTSFGILYTLLSFLLPSFLKFALQPANFVLKPCNLRPLALYLLPVEVQITDLAIHHRLCQFAKIL